MDFVSLHFFNYLRELCLNEVSGGFDAWGLYYLMLEGEEEEEDSI
jgi:hypothetical protein